MTDQEAADFLSKEWGRPVSLSEAAEINRDVTNLAEIVVDAFLESEKTKRRAIIEQQAPLPGNVG